MSYYDEEDSPRTRVFGTPLPQLARGEDAAKKADLDLTVRDDKGRRRFHGAFTGGFSAGHFNTVGSVEGWVPSQFKSNRNEKWSRDLVKSKPEDYMDPEDMDVFGIAHQRVQTTDKFTGESSRGVAGGFAGFRDPSLSMGDVLREVVRPTRESIGVKLYKAMKRGPRFKGQIETEATARVIGPTLPTAINLMIDDNDRNLIETFKLPYEPKSDQHGIGYVGMSKSDLLGRQSSSAVTATLGGKRLAISGEAFGTGALSDEEDLDEDVHVYGKDDMTQYDFAIGGKQAKQKRGRGVIPGESVLNMNKLEGFEKESKERMSSFESLSKMYPLPELPRHYRAKPPWASTNRTSSDRDGERKKRSRWDDKKDEQDDKGHREQSSNRYHDRPSSSHRSDRDHHSSDKDRHQRPPPSLNANARAVLLGEEVIRVTATKPSKSEDFKKPQDVLPIKSAPIKPKIKLPEVVEATITTPLQGFFACKFTRSVEKNAEAGPKLDPGLTTPEEVSLIAKETLPTRVALQIDEEKPDIGAIRRTNYQWHPHKVLSRRFNIPMPYEQFPDVVGVLIVGNQESVRNRTSIVETPTAFAVKPKSVEQDLVSSLFTSVMDAKSSEPSRKRSDYEESVNPVPSATVASEVERPSIDLFRAIFASDEEKESDDEEEQSKTVNSNLSNPVRAEQSSAEELSGTPPRQATPMSTQSTTIKEPNQHNQRRDRFAPIVDRDVRLVKLEPDLERNQNSDDDGYGPALPPGDEPTLIVNPVNEIVDESRSDRKKHSKKRKKDSKSSSKKKKSKDKKKSKKRKKESKSTKSSSESDSDGHSSDDGLDKAEMDAKLLALLKSRR